jgi:NACHT domain
MVHEIKNINKGLERIISLQKSLHREQMDLALAQERQACHQAFKTSPYERYKNVNPDRVDGTCRWILENPQYIDWWESRYNSMLWITADPGCGKSVLAKSLIDIDFKRSDSPLNICYFFFKDNEEQNDLATALCAVLHQLFQMSPDLLHHALPSWRSNGPKVQQEVEELWRILIAATSDSVSPNTICILDAIDECKANDAQQLIGKLEQVYTRTATSSTPKGWLKFLVTSRPYEEIQQSLRLLTEPNSRIHLRGEENDRIHEEINLVVKTRVAELTESLELSLETRQRVELHLLQMEHRTYLWVSLAMDDIRTTFQESLRPEEEPLPLISPAVNAAYERILDRVSTTKVEIVKTILQIIVGARRPLTIEEMAMALGVAMSSGPQAAGLNPEGLEKKLRHLCKLFIFIKDSKIYLIHQTAREFLFSRSPTSKWYFEQNGSEKLMSRVCIHYLLMDNLEKDQSQNNPNNRIFLAYATEHWADHVQNMSPPADLELAGDLARIYNITSARIASCFTLFSGAVIKPGSMSRMKAYNLAASSENENVMQTLLTRDEIDIDEPGGIRNKLLYLASETGYIKAMDILELGDNGNALGSALTCNDLENTNVLLEQEADVDAFQDTFDTRPLKKLKLDANNDALSTD